MKLYIARYGEIDLNANGDCYQGSTDMPLNAKGRAQATALALAQCGNGQFSARPLRRIRTPTGHRWGCDGTQLACVPAGEGPPASRGSHPASCRISAASRRLAPPPGTRACRDGEHRRRAKGWLLQQARSGQRAWQSAVKNGRFCMPAPLRGRSRAEPDFGAVEHAECVSQTTSAGRQTIHFLHCPRVPLSQFAARSRPWPHSILENGACASALVSARSRLARSQTSIM